MSNHGSDMTPEERRHFDKFFQEMKTEMKLGPTGGFPDGKVHKKDEGEIKISIGHKNGKVFIAFGTPVEWMGFTREQALNIANTLISHAAELTPSPNP